MIKEQGLSTFKHDIEFDYNFWTTGKEKTRKKRKLQ